MPESQKKYIADSGVSSSASQTPTNSWSQALNSQINSLSRYQIPGHCWLLPVSSLPEEKLAIAPVTGSVYELLLPYKTTPKRLRHGMGISKTGVQKLALHKAQIVVDTLKTSSFHASRKRHQPCLDFGPSCLETLSLMLSFYPLVIERSYWKWPFIVDFPIKMVIFHSYVSLPEGIPIDDFPLYDHHWCTKHKYIRHIPMIFPWSPQISKMYEENYPLVI